MKSTNKTYKVLIPYADWLIMTRGEIRPEVGDEYFDHLFGSWARVEAEDIEYLTKRLSHAITNRHDYYVEIDYNPNEAIEFAEWVGENYFIQNDNESWATELLKYSGCIYTTEELFKIFKQEQNGTKISK